MSRSSTCSGRRRRIRDRRQLDDLLRLRLRFDFFGLVLRNGSGSGSVCSSCSLSIGRLTCSAAASCASGASSIMTMLPTPAGADQLTPATGHDRSGDAAVQPQNDRRRNSAHRVNSRRRMHRGASGHHGRCRLFKRDQRDLEIAGAAQEIHHLHDLAVGHGLVGAQEDRLILVAVRRRGQAHPTRARARDDFFADRQREIRLDGEKHRLVRPRLRFARSPPAD